MRQLVLQDLRKLSAIEKSEKSSTIQKKLKDKLSSKSGLWAAFQPMSIEPQLQWSEISNSIQWCFPVMSKDTLRFKKAATKFFLSGLGFLEPVDGEFIELHELAGAIVPGLSFDSQGFRLGRGRGFYDQTFKNIKSSLIGVCFQTAFKNELPHEAHDLKCNFIITENQSVVIEGA